MCRVGSGAKQRMQDLRSAPIADQHKRDGPTTSVIPRNRDWHQAAQLRLPANSLKIDTKQHNYGSLQTHSRLTPSSTTTAPCKLTQDWHQAAQLRLPADTLEITPSSTTTAPCRHTWDYTKQHNYGSLQTHSRLTPSSTTTAPCKLTQDWHQAAQLRLEIDTKQHNYGSLQTYSSLTPSSTTTAPCRHLRLHQAALEITPRSTTTTRDWHQAAQLRLPADTLEIDTKKHNYDSRLTPSSTTTAPCRHTRDWHQAAQLRLPADTLEITPSSTTTTRDWHQAAQLRLEIDTKLHNYGSLQTHSRLTPSSTTTAPCKLTQDWHQAAQLRLPADTLEITPSSTTTTPCRHTQGAYNHKQECDNHTQELFFTLCTTYHATQFFPSTNNHCTASVIPGQPRPRTPNRCNLREKSALPMLRRVQAGIGTRMLKPQVSGCPF